MKRTREIAVGVAVALVAAWMLWGRDGRRDEGEEEALSPAVRQRMEEAESALATARRKHRALLTEIAGQSNRADAAEALYETETSTLEPLRRQIEKMLSREIELNADLKTRQNDIAAARAELDAARKQAAAAEAQRAEAGKTADAIRGKVVELEKAAEALRKGAAEAAARDQAQQKELADLRAGVQRAEAACKAAETKLGDAEARVKKLETDLAAGVKANADLKKQIEELSVKAAAQKAASP